MVKMKKKSIIKKVNTQIPNGLFHQLTNCNRENIYDIRQFGKWAPIFIFITVSPIYRTHI